MSGYGGFEADAYYSLQTNAIASEQSYELPGARIDTLINDGSSDISFAVGAPLGGKTEFRLKPNESWEAIGLKAKYISCKAPSASTVAFRLWTLS